MPKRYCRECKKETEHGVWARGFRCVYYEKHKRVNFKPETILKGVILTELGNVNILKDLATLGSIIYDIAYKYHGKKADTQDIINAQIALKELGVEIVETDACGDDFDWPKENQERLRLSIDKMIDESEQMSPDSLTLTSVDKNGKKESVTIYKVSIMLKVLKLNKRGIAYLKRLRRLGFRF
ncbi:MAG TPA: hypothetical protein P5056_02545 [Candidatus Paceibacterota bacterium]|nr:hypothetical protein [Candidatus Paceibacterota bacterium]